MSFCLKGCSWVSGYCGRTKQNYSMCVRLCISTDKGGNGAINWFLDQCTLVRIMDSSIFRWKEAVFVCVQEVEQPCKRDDGYFFGKHSLHKTITVWGYAYMQTFFLKIVFQRSYCWCYISKGTTFSRQILCIEWRMLNVYKLLVFWKKGRE